MLAPPGCKWDNPLWAAKKAAKEIGSKDDIWLCLDSQQDYHQCGRYEFAIDVYRFRSLGEFQVNHCYRQFLVKEDKRIH